MITLKWSAKLAKIFNFSKFGDSAAATGNVGGYEFHPPSANQAAGQFRVTLAAIHAGKDCTAVVYIWFVVGAVVEVALAVVKGEFPLSGLGAEIGAGNGVVVDKYSYGIHGDVATASLIVENGRLDGSSTMLTPSARSERPEISVQSMQFGSDFELEENP